MTGDNLPPLYLQACEQQGLDPHTLHRIRPARGADGKFLPKQRTKPKPKKATTSAQRPRPRPEPATS